MDVETGHGKTLDGLERNAERDRADLAGTMETLRKRFTSGGDGLAENLSARARGYVEDRRSAAVEGLWKRVEDHPLQTVALAAGIAYPIVRIAAKIPAPILMLGAGVALVGRGGSDRSETSVTVGDRATAPSAGLTGADSRTPYASATIGAAVSETGSDAGLRPSDGSSTQGGSVSRSGDRAMKAARAGGETIVGSIRCNPAIAGGISLALGAALAALLPRTRVESRAFGEAAEDVRERARSLAAEGVDVGRKAMGAALDEAEAQNLTKDGAGAVIRDATDRADATINDTAEDVRDGLEAKSQAASDDTLDGKAG